MGAGHPYPHLFAPLRIRSVIFPNRVFVSSMGCPPTHQHPSSPRYDAGVGFYDKCAGGAAAMLVGVPPLDTATGQYPKYEKDRIREVMSLAGQSGSKVGANLGMHGIDRESGIHYAPSTYCKPNGQQLHEAPVEKLLQFVDELRDSACEARRFGFDYIQYHMAHESMASHFLAPGFNTRTDEFGGSLENRMRFPIMALRALREGAGAEMPIIVRLSAELHCKESYSFDEMLMFIGEIRSLIDMVNVSAGMDTWYKTNIFHCTTPFQPHNINFPYAARIKEACPELLVCPVGGIVDPQDGEDAIAEGKVDAIMLGRAMNADPLWPKKAKEGRAEDIVPCLRCSYCYHAANNHDLIACSVNPRFFRENRVPIKLAPAERAKRVVVVGGGPGGCKAALTACARGHEVILLEKTDEVGGAIKHARFDGHKSDLARYQRYLVRQVSKAAIDVRYGIEATPELVRSLDPDAVIVAIGAEPVMPSIPGIESSIVREAVSCYGHLEEVPQHVVIVGGGTVGCEMALRLAEDGRDVTVVEATDTLCAQGHMLYRIGIEEAMSHVADRLHFHTEARCVRIEDDGVEVERGGNRFKVGAEMVMIAVGQRPLIDLAFSFYGIAPETYSVGDCDRVGKVLEATSSAYFVAASL